MIESQNKIVEIAKKLGEHKILPAVYGTIRRQLVKLIEKFSCEIQCNYAKI